MLDDPVRQRLLEADVASGLFRLNPLVPENFLPLGLKLTVKRGVFKQIVRRRWLFCSVRHKVKFNCVT